ncbi:sterol desaturase family protein [Streptomyces europaeiscabiei]|uniref:sterol desaturase family protein n=1 Tax=Streptomyces europaeiscabiei TaxID=146819 RepID=UPI0038F749E3
MTANESLRWEESAGRADRLRASPPMFRSRFLDCFTRVHPAVPPLLHGPVVLLLLAWAVRHTGALLLLVYVLLGYGVWTLTEYWVHRALFHFTPRSAWGRRAHWMAHGVHHDHPNDPRRLVMPPSVTVPGAYGAYELFHLLAGTGPGAALTGGFVAGYVVYDVLHFHMHHHRPSTALGRRLRNRHLRHHFQDERRGFGVSCPYWDHVFGTAPR